MRDELPAPPQRICVATLTNLIMHRTSKTRPVPVGILTETSPRCMVCDFTRLMGVAEL
jgi:hypothetical protein